MSIQEMFVESDCPCKNVTQKNVGGFWHLSCVSASITSRVKNHAREKKSQGFGWSQDLHTGI